MKLMRFVLKCIIIKNKQSFLDFDNIKSKLVCKTHVYFTCVFSSIYVSEKPHGSCSFKKKGPIVTFISN